MLTIINNINCKQIFISDKYTRFCQWKNLELNISVSNLM